MSTSEVWLETEPQQQLGALREGGLHYCEGPLRRRRHRAQTKLNKWKQKWFKVEPGKDKRLRCMKKSCNIF